MKAPSATTRAVLIALLMIGPALAGGAGPAVPATAFARDGRFIPGFADVPLMPELQPVEAETLVFDKPSGRIAQTAAQGTIRPAAVRAFYAQAMPQLGWRAVAPDRFERDGEVLRLEFVEDAAKNGLSKVRFTLMPR